MPQPVALALDGLARAIRTGQPRDISAEKNWRAADLSYKCWPVQLEMGKVLTSTTTVSQGSLKKVLKCARRLRKTTTALIKAMETVGLVVKNGLIRFAAPTREDLVTIVHPIMDMLTEDAPPDLKPVWYREGHYYLFPSTGVKMFMAGAANIKQIGLLRGKAADLAIVDEAQEILHLKYLVDDVLMPQLLGIDQPRGPLWMLFTPPKTPIHDCYKYAAEAQAAGTYAEFDIYKGQYHPDVIEIFKKEAGGDASTTWMREYLVKDVVDENYIIVPEWDEQKYMQAYAPDEFYPFYFKYEGMDIGGTRHFTAVLYAVYDFRRAKLYVLNETVIARPRMTTEVLAADIKKMEGDLWGEKVFKPAQKPQLRIADSNNPILLDDLGRIHQIHFRATDKDELPAMVNNMRLWVGAGRVIVSPTCSHLLGCLKYGVWNDNRTDWEESSAYGHFDGLAALMYLVRNVNIVTNPVPKMHGLNPDTQHINPVALQPENVEQMKAALLKMAPKLKRR